MLDKLILSLCQKYSQKKINYYLLIFACYIQKSYLYCIVMLIKGFVFLLSDLYFILYIKLTSSKIL